MSSPITQQTKEPAEPAQPVSAESTPNALPVNPKLITWSAFLFAALQSACTAVMAISGLRVAIGLSALAAAAGIQAPARGFPQDAILIPMIVLPSLQAALTQFLLFKM